jgi:hypothetical protein
MSTALKWNQLILASVSAMFIKIWLAEPVHSKSLLEVDLCCYFSSSSD